ncbi:hypothetical protein ACTU3I_03270 [Microbacterium sp. RD1]|uniref:hypothetical protein n=1 Tax=Microbacterium sp. RD1 TaxID=3457313 RepID=UPI003FA5D5DB
MSAGRRSTRAARGVTAVLMLTALAGCAAWAPSAPPTAAPAGLPATVTVSLVQLRADVAARQAQVQIRNGGEEAVRVAGVEVRDRRFDGVAERVVARESVIPAGGAVDVRIQLPPMDCAAPAEGDSTAVLTLDEVEVEAPIVDTLGFLPALHARECLAVRLGEVAAIEIDSFTPGAAGQAGSLQLAVTPTGSGSAHLGAVDSTPLLMYALDGRASPYDLAVDIGPDSPASTIVIPLVPQRCDPHVVQEDKRGTIFTIDVTVGDTAGEIDLAAPPDLKARMLAWVAEWCGFAPADGIDPPPAD